MAFTISTKQNPDDIWMVKRTGYMLLMEYIQTRFPGDEDVHEAMWLGLISNGISLYVTFEKDPVFALKLRDRLLIAAEEIARCEAGVWERFRNDADMWERFVPESVADEPMIEKEKVARSKLKKVYGPLADILRRWTPEQE